MRGEAQRSHLSVVLGRLGRVPLLVGAGRALLAYGDAEERASAGNAVGKL